MKQNKKHGINCTVFDGDEKIIKVWWFHKTSIYFSSSFKKWVQNKHTHSIVKKDKGEKFAVIKPL